MYVYIVTHYKLYPAGATQSNKHSMTATPVTTVPPNYIIYMYVYIYMYTCICMYSLHWHAMNLWELFCSAHTWLFKLCSIKSHLFRGNRLTWHHFVTQNSHVYHCKTKTPILCSWTTSDQPWYFLPMVITSDYMRLIHKSGTVLAMPVKLGVQLVCEGVSYLRIYGK